ncbi:MAG: hypothetical protein M5R36_12255 [Deltaproteobacteria bacterium]|nr:hypothetical protein [Deltaproteobacteria bacterium]
MSGLLSKRRFLYRTVFALVASFAVMTAEQAPADVLFSYGFNARGIALGGATVAQSKDSASPTTIPAAVS